MIGETPANADSAPYWNGASESRLMLQHCPACGSFQFPPRHHCASCWRPEPDWRESMGSGCIESFTVVRRSPLPAYRDSVPYVVVAVILDDGPRMITNLVGDDALDAEIGDRVAICFVDDATGRKLPQFRRSGQGT